MDKIRNFSIIAHIDHGKSTLSDRIIQICNGLSDYEMESRMLDSMDLERERGITIKAQSVTLNYKSIDGKTYQLNFIDTPGHVDFSYEVSRSLAACEGAMLIIDAGQGIEAQTLAHYYTAVEMNLKIVPVINKIDLPSANPEKVIADIKDTIGIDTSNIVCCSAKTGAGLIHVIERLVHDVPAPKGSPNAPLQALIIDSWFDNYLGVISLVRVKNGIIHKADKIKAMSTGQVYKIERLGIFTPNSLDRTELKCGEVGWLICAVKDKLGTPVGDTLTGVYNPSEKTLHSFKKIKPQVYAALFPISIDDYESFRDALSKLSLNDPSLFYEPENSSVLGFGFRCGFLGLLHMEIIQERLEREYNLNLITTMPTVVYEVQTINGEVVYIDNPSKLPPLNNINELREPIAECRIISPQEYVGNVITLCAEKRGIQTNIIYHDKQVALIYEIPMAEIILDFFNRLKSVSHGYASLDYRFKYFQTAKVVCINILINGKRIDPLTIITHNNHALYRGRELVKKMQVLIPRQQFDVIIQAVIDNRIIARSTIKQLRKNVLAKCHASDITRKKKLLHKQKEGKKRMKRLGNIEIPQEAFLAILSISKK